MRLGCVCLRRCPAGWEGPEPAHLRRRNQLATKPGRSAPRLGGWARPAAADGPGAYQSRARCRGSGAEPVTASVSLAHRSRVGAVLTSPGPPAGRGDTNAGVGRRVLRVPGHPTGPAPRGLTIPLSELLWRFSGAGGPGGQHVNTSNTRAEVRLDIARSPSIPEAARTLLVERLGDVVAVAASDRRSQPQNRDLALSRLTDRLAGALEVQRSRRPTRPTRGSERRRLEAKRRQAQRKQERGGRWED